MNWRILNIGDRYGRLEIVEYIGTKPTSGGVAKAYLCKCDCGNLKEVIGKSLGRGVSSCGCLSRATIIKEGTVFGRLTVIQSAKSEGEGRRYLCKCECGKETVVTGRLLKRGDVRSCGCLYLENSIKKIEKVNKENVIENTSINQIKPTGLRKNNTSGVRGVDWDIVNKKWRARIIFKGKRYDLGKFDNIEDAAKARKAAEEKMFEPFLEQYYAEKNNDK